MSDIGQRIKDAAETVGGLNQLAEIIGIPRRTLGDYVAGKSEPKISAMLEISRATGETLDWLITGAAGTQARPDKQSTNQNRLEAELMMELGRVVVRLHKEAHVRLPPEAIPAEAALLYNDLLAHPGVDIRDRDEVAALIPWLEMRLRKRLAEAAAEPGTGKRLA